MNCRFIQPTPQPAHIGGGREIWELVGNGPTSYNQTTGDLISGPSPGEHFSVPFGGFLTPDGIYELKPFSTTPGTTGSLRLTWGFRWFFAGSAGTSVVSSVTGSGGSGMTVGTYPLSFTNSGTGGSGEAGTITVLTATTYTITITNPGSGFTSAPTVSAATGGTPPTLTAHLSAAGAEVSTGINLSAEYVQFGAIGGQL